MLKDSKQNQLEKIAGSGLSGSSHTPVKGSESAGTAGAMIWEIRTEEQPYAFLSDKKIEESNRYGQKIDLIDLTEHKLPVGRSLYINENPAVGTNPNRNKQHGFYFTADNCIGCHACEAACAEKNETPAHFAFRSVGYVEGGSFPDYKRMNISMACNHCDNPVCLKGCPTRAYTKHVEYGAVLQDPETCFGCGYCTWVCPYNAPQLDPVKGQVSKCNMCVDRLEVGLKPACVSACVGNALDFGVIENVPDNREQALTDIPGFPNSEITHPNVRFQQINQLPDEMKRTDSMPLKYHKDENGRYKPTIDQKKGKSKHWNLARLSSRENPLVLFTLCSQASIGAFALSFLGAQAGIAALVSFQQSALYAPLAILSFLLVGFGLFMSTMHLGKPHRFYRGFNNLRHSPVCREGLGIALFMAGLGLHILFSLPGNRIFQNLYTWLLGSDISALIGPATAQSWAAAFGYFAIPASLAGLYYMNRCYRIEARPFWNHWQVGSAFFGNMLSLGGLVAGAVIVPTLAFSGVDFSVALLVCGGLMALGLLVEAIGHLAHSKAMASAEHEGGASYYIQSTTFGKTFLARNLLLAANLCLVTGLLIALAVWNLDNLYALLAWCFAGGLLIATSIVGRALFYVLVIPTTMPGAFFWKNKGFEEHARDIGLANMPQVGVAPLNH
ncbi:dimethyl sulfoxide reductase anchor subunit [Simiduia curdlanivorans]|uniref:DmsC/YnfH family molybdoenzyme membrane anchor subunit n=1 Tax=Simiduia curdlanivorans TaxID=1492769 RepID=A0ABV8V771_9GAMM|nr:DmsC/YnfH family molybdoenzyme membrane anchor subunit [Simiduia curdlanivorans]MDN3639090.1 dimethyl sulfoxide reductase anchor subunit [Simiduia curdlanivorans]